MTDAYEPAGMRLAQSYMDDSGLNDIGFIYDNALTICALIAAGDLAGPGPSATRCSTPRTTTRPTTTAGCGRPTTPNTSSSRQRHARTSAGSSAWSGPRSATWPGPASRWPSWPAGCRAATTSTAPLRIGHWIVDNTLLHHRPRRLHVRRDRRSGGHKSTEHNIDVYAFFRLLARLTGDGRWSSRANHALEFIEAVWNDDDGFFWTGSDDGAAINKNPKQLPLDVQTWFWLSVGKGKYAECLDWASTNLRSTDTPLRINSALTGHDTFTGAVFGSGTLRADVTARGRRHRDWRPLPDDGGVWFEGTGQLALALRKRDRTGDLAASDALLATLRTSQDPARRRTRPSAAKRIDGGIQAATLADRHRLRLRLSPAPAHRGHVLVRDGRDRVQPVLVRLRHSLPAAACSDGPLPVGSR